jgi:hypothetical protein
MKFITWTDLNSRWPPVRNTH